MPPSGKCLRPIALAATMVDEFVAKYNTLTKTIFS